MLEPKLFLHAVYVDEQGHLQDVATGHPLRLAPQAHLHLLLHDPAHVTEVRPFVAQKRLVVPAGETMEFVLKQTEWGALWFSVRLLDDVWLFQEEENKPPVLGPAQPCVIEMLSHTDSIFRPQPPPLPDNLRADTLNQAYFQTSKLYEPKGASHACNVHRDFRTSYLDHTLRELWDIIGQHPDFWATRQQAHQ